MNDIVLSKVTSTNGTLSIKEIPLALAKKMCVENHYSHSWNKNFGVINFGIFQNDNPVCLGVFSLGWPMNPQSYRSISSELKNGELLELNRLWVDDCLGRNTETVFISLCMKYLKRYRKDIKMVQSFADGRLGCGTIYKAANFTYYGFHRTMFLERIDKPGKTYHKVPFENTARIVAMVAHNMMLVRGDIKAFKTKTHRYIYNLSKLKVDIEEQTYPEYSKGVEYIDDYKQTLSVMSRVWLCLYSAGMSEASEVFEYITEHYGVHDHDTLFKIASSRSMDIIVENITSVSKRLRSELYAYADDKLGYNIDLDRITLF